MKRATKPRAARTVEETRELANGAKAILDDPAFKTALEDAQERLMNALIRSSTEEESRDLVAKLKCLMQIAAELAVLTNDYRMAADRARRARPS
jgi:hypothetical protein